jgi:hypothetical protein
MASSKSYDAFSSVDKLVAKPVVGSDGAAAWQDFRKETKMSAHTSVAPSMPLKKTDRLSAASFGEERLVEDRVRNETGEAAVGEGYTTFRRKNTAEEAASRKKRKQIENRIRPDEKKYYIAATAFEGWKFDYVFTTRDRGTGYYWDGHDSIKKLNGEELPEATEASSEVVMEQDEKPKRKKKKEKEAAAPVIVDDPNNPMEQVANAIRRRNEALHAAPLGLAAGWEVAVDPSCGKTYYFCRTTGERQWDRPTAASSTAAALSLPPGWSVAKDASTGKEYFYHTSGETKWERPSF